MKKFLLLSGLVLGTFFTSSAQETVTFPSTPYQGGYFSTAYTGGQLHGVLTSISVDVTLDASVDQTFASDFAVLVATGLTATDQLLLQAGGFSNFGFDEKIDWGTGDSDVIGTMCTATVTLETPIDFDANPTFNVYFGNGYAGEASSGAWSGSFTLNGVSTDLLAVKQNDSKNAFSVFPNPATNVVNVANTNGGISNVILTDLNGRAVKTASFDGVSNAQVNIADLSTGVYMMKIEGASGSTVKKIVKN